MKLATIMQTGVVPIMVGLVFGAAFQLGHIQEFYFVRNQMDFSTAVMLKMFLAAAATSMVAFEIIDFMGNGKKLNEMGGWATCKPYRGMLSIMTGSIMLGCGMYLSGSCPGTVYAQIGGGSKKALATWTGGILGAFLYGLVDAYFPEQLTWLTNKGKLQQNYTLDVLVGFSPKVTKFLLVIFLCGLIVMFEMFYPWKKDLIGLYNTFDEPYDPSFPYEVTPALAGVFIGMLQLPLFYLVGMTLGTATTYATVVANLLPWWKSSLHLNACRTFYWQIFLTVGIILGSLAYTNVSGNFFVSDSMVTWAEAVAGGVLFQFGARIAGGCTSGHGITGMSYLGLNSMAATAGMFGGAIGFGYMYNGLATL